MSRLPARAAGPVLLTDSKTTLRQSDGALDVVSWLESVRCPPAAVALAPLRVSVAAALVYARDTQAAIGPHGHRSQVERSDQLGDLHHGHHLPPGRPQIVNNGGRRGERQGSYR